MLVLVFVLVLGAAVAQTATETEAKAVLCGRELAKTHAMYCYGIDPIPEESSESDLLLPPPEFSTDLHKDSVSKIPGRFTFRARRRRSAADVLSDAELWEACCLKPCHMSELLGHC